MESDICRIHLGSFVLYNVSQLGVRRPKTASRFPWAASLFRAFDDKRVPWSRISAGFTWAALCSTTSLNVGVRRPKTASRFPWAASLFRAVDDKRVPWSRISAGFTWEPWSSKASSHRRV
ncbi:unnamed protein product [Calypogeia fissa]